MDRGPIGGERLAEARRLRQISLPDIARELHLDEAKVQALEENRFDVLGAPVFAKGHMRKYAELVGVPLDDLLSDYYKLNRASGAPPVVGPPRRPQRELNLGPWLVGVPLVLVALAAVYWWLGRGPLPGLGSAAVDEDRVDPLRQQLPLEVNRAPAAPAPAIPGSPAIDAEPAAGGPDSASADRATGGADTASPSPADEDAPPAAAAPPVENAASATATRAPGNALPGGEVSLSLTYSGDCWTEVTDGSGERLFFDLGRSGRTVTVSGRPPLRVLLGDSNNVSLSVDGEPYRIRAADLRGDTARLTINR